MCIWGGVCNMYTGTLVDVINEATIKAPDRPVAGVHHLINKAAEDKKKYGIVAVLLSKNNMDDEDRAMLHRTVRTARGRALAKRAFSDKFKAGGAPNFSDSDKRFMATGK